MEYEKFDEIPEEATYVTPFDELMQRLEAEEAETPQEPKALPQASQTNDNAMSPGRSRSARTTSKDKTGKKPPSALPAILICVLGLLVGLGSIGAGIWTFSASEFEASRQARYQLALEGKLQEADVARTDLKNTLARYRGDLTDAVNAQKQYKTQLDKLSAQLNNLTKEKTALAKANQDLQQEKQVLERTTKQQQTEIAKLKAADKTDPKNLTSKELIKQSQDALSAGDLQTAWKLINSKPGRGKVTKDLQVAREEVRWKLYLRKQTLAERPLTRDAKEVKQVFQTLAEIKTPTSLYLRGQIEEECGNFDDALQLYAKGITKFPDESKQFRAGIMRVKGRVTSTAGLKRKKGVGSGKVLHIGYILFQEPGKGKKGNRNEGIEEAGYLYWNAVEAAREHKYKQAVQLLTAAKKLHEKRRKLLPHLRLNPTSDDPEQIFQRSCDQLLVYWKMREFLKEKGLKVPTTVAGEVKGHVALLNKLSKDDRGNFLKIFGKALLPKVKTPTEKQILNKAKELRTIASKADDALKKIQDRLALANKEVTKAKVAAANALKNEKQAKLAATKAKKQEVEVRKDLLATTKKLNEAADTISGIEKELKKAKLLKKKGAKLLPVVKTLLKDRSEVALLVKKAKAAKAELAKAKKQAEAEAKRAKQQARLAAENEKRALVAKKEAEAAEKAFEKQVKALKQTQKQAREAKQTLQAIAKKLGCPPTPEAILKKLKVPEKARPKSTSAALLSSALEQLQLGRLEQARDIFDMQPSEKKPSPDLKAWRARIRWLIYQQQQAKNDKASRYDDQEVQSVLAALKQVKTPKALLWRAQIAEETGKTDRAKELYAEGIKLYPKGSSVFRIALERIQSRPPEMSRDSASSIMAPLVEQVATLLVTTMLQWDGSAASNEQPLFLPETKVRKQPAAITQSDEQWQENIRRIIREAKKQMPKATEAGELFYDALGLARTGKYDEAITKLQQARKLHEKRRKMFPTRNLNPRSDPRSEIFPRCCLQIEVYWRTRQLLSKANYELPDLKTSVETQLQPYRKLLADLKAAQNLVAALRKKGKGGPVHQDGKSLATLKAVLRQCKENEETLSLIAEQLHTSPDRNALLGAIARLNTSTNACALSLHDEIMTDLCHAGWRFPHDVSAAVAVRILIQDWHARGELLQQQRAACWNALTHDGTALDKVCQATLATQEARAALQDAFKAKAAAERQTKLVVAKLARTTLESKIQIADLRNTLTVANQKMDLAIQKQREAQAARTEAETARDEAEAAHQLAVRQKEELERNIEKVRQDRAKLQETLVRIASKLRSLPDRANLLRAADRLVQNPTAEELLPAWAIVLRDPDQIELADRGLQAATMVLARGNDDETNIKDVAWAQYVKALALRNKGYCQEARGTLEGLLEGGRETLPEDVHALATKCFRQLDSVLDYYERRGEELKSRGALEKSLWLLDRGISELPDAGRLYALRCLVLLEAARRTKDADPEAIRQRAQQDAVSAIAKGANDVGNYAAGRVAEDRQRWKQAHAHFRAALDAHPQEDQAKQTFRLALARVLLVRSDLKLE